METSHLFTPEPLKLGRGINVMGYDPIWYDFEKRRFKGHLFSKIKHAGFDHLRLNLHAFRHQLGEDTDYRLKDTWFNTLDWIVDNALRNGLKIILDLHEYDSLGQDAGATQKARFISFWKQISNMFSTYSNRVFFEILNEPNRALNAEKWQEFMDEALSIIRKFNPERPVVVGPINWNSMDALDTMKLPENDRNLIVTVHYYKPMAFTHQGARWTSPEYANRTGVKWGSDEDKSNVVKDFEKAQAWSIVHKRPIYLGEFGAYDKGEFQYRLLYTDFVCRTAEKMKWDWAYWQFDSDFVAYRIEEDDWVKPILNGLIPNSPEL